MLTSTVQRKSIGPLVALGCLGADWSGLLQALGSESFPLVLRKFLSELIAPEQCIAFYHQAMGAMVNGCDCVMAPQSPAGAECSRLRHGSPHWIRLNDARWRVAIGFSVGAPEHFTPDADLCQRLTVAGEALAAIVCKHVEISSNTAVASQPLACLGTIETCLGEMVHLPKREAQVC